MSKWDESKHPRKPAGSPKGGEFTSKGGKKTRSARYVPAVTAGEIPLREVFKAGNPPYEFTAKDLREMKRRGDREEAKSNEWMRKLNEKYKAKPWLDPWSKKFGKRPK